MAEKKRWWIRIEESFFQEKRIKALGRKYKGEAQIIYQRILLRCLSTNFRMEFEGLEETFAEEVAAELDFDDIDLVENVLQFLESHKLMIRESDTVFYFPMAETLSGSEGASAERMRNKRQRDRDASQSDDDMSHCSVITDTDKDTDKEREKEKTDHNRIYQRDRSVFIPSLSFSDLSALCKKEHIDSDEDEMKAYIQSMTDSNWTDAKGNPIKSFGAHYRDWLKHFHVHQDEWKAKTILLLSEQSQGVLKELLREWRQSKPEAFEQSITLDEDLEELVSDLDSYVKGNEEAMWWEWSYVSVVYEDTCSGLNQKIYDEVSADIFKARDKLNAMA